MNKSNWPNPEQPGVLLFADRDGAHAFEYEKSGKDFEYGGCISCAEEIRNLGAAP